MGKTNMKGVNIKYDFLKARFVCLLLIPLAVSSGVNADAVLTVSDSKKGLSIPTTQARASSQGQQQMNAQWALVNQLDQLQQEVQQLRGIVEEQAYQLKQIKKGARERYLNLDGRIAALSAVPARPAALSGVQPSTANPGNSTVSASETVALTVAQSAEKALYDQARAQIKGRRYIEAVKTLLEMLEKYPEGAYVPYAHYWLGEVYLALAVPRYQDAEINFLTMLQSFPGHSKTPAVLYKLGKLYDKTDQPVLARKYLNRVADEYPRDSAAALAKNYLQEMMSAK